MDLVIAKRLIKKYVPGHMDLITKTDAAERYYRNKTDILSYKKDEKEKDENPLRNADNRICSSFYSLLVNQKASYMFTAPPLFDIGNKSANQKIADTLGDKYAKNCKSLCINASNFGSAWIHYWKDEEATFHYGILKGQQVIPIYNNDLEKELYAVIRTYRNIDEETGKTIIVYEIWTDKECYAYSREEDLKLEDGLKEYDMFYINDALTNTSQETNIYKHEFGKVPFIQFCNNDLNSSDLEAIKGLIDTYDKTFSGFANDLEDIQEIIFVLSGYEGTDLGPFLNNIKKYKTVKLDADDDGKPGMETLTIDIPVEARNTLLQMTRKAIFEQGQGVDPDPANFGNASGVALKYLYSLLELKAGLMETEFRIGFGELVRAICNFNHLEVKQIIQTWTRTSISNDTELATIAKDSVGVISNKTILKNHPWVENADQEEKQIKTEKESELNEGYNGAFGGKDINVPSNDPGKVGGENGEE